MENLAKKRCVPCEGGVAYLKDDKIGEYLSQIQGWNLSEVSNHKQITKSFKFKDFKEAINFVNKVADIAESEGHHPNIDIQYNKVELTNYTHAIGGLHDNDFILAAKVDELAKHD